jgi:hypothetical protein
VRQQNRGAEGHVAAREVRRQAHAHELVIGLADNVQILLLGLFITGFNVAFMDIAINGQAVEIEKHTQGRWMSSFHGFWLAGARGKQGCLCFASALD